MSKIYNVGDTFTPRRGMEITVHTDTDSYLAVITQVLDQRFLASSREQFENGEYESNLPTKDIARIEYPKLNYKISTDNMQNRIWEICHQRYIENERREYKKEKGIEFKVNKLIKVISNAVFDKNLEIRTDFQQK